MNISDNYLRKEIRKAYIAGFMSSGDGCNADWFSGEDDLLENDDFNKRLSEYLDKLIEEDSK